MPYCLPENGGIYGRRIVTDCDETGETEPICCRRATAQLHLGARMTRGGAATTFPRPLQPLASRPPWPLAPLPLSVVDVIRAACMIRGNWREPAPPPFVPMKSPFTAPAHTLPKAAQAILALPGVQSLEREPDGWCCHLMHGWTTAALGGGGTIVDGNLATIRAYVRAAYQLPEAAAPAPAPARPVLPGETLPPAPPVWAAPAPELPFVTRSQQQQQPQQGRPLAPAPAPLVAPGPRARKTAPARLPADVAALLGRFGLSLDGLLTVGASNAKLAKGAALAWPVILHHLPARSLAQAVAGAEPGPTAPRSRLPGLAALAEREQVLSLALAHNGCPWASQGCAAGCLAWAGHGGLSQTVAAARARRTLAFLADPAAYGRAILWAIARAYRQAQAKGLPLAVRLRGTDDLAWHLQRLTVSPAEAVSLARRYGLPVAPGRGQTLPEALSLAPAGSVRLYEYSAAPVHGLTGLQAQRAAGFDTTCSLKADRPDGLRQALQAIAASFRLAVPVALPKGAALPPVLLLRRGPGAPAWRLLTVDGDLTDHRWADPAGPQPARPGVPEAPFDGVAVLLRTKRSRGRGPEAEAFSLQPVWDRWQPLAGGGQALLTAGAPWEALPA